MKRLPVGRTLRVSDYKGETTILGSPRGVVLVERRTGRLYAIYFPREMMIVDPNPPPETIEHLDDAIRLAPRDPEGYRHRGDAYLEEGEEDRAYADYTKALEVARPIWPGRAEVERKLSTLSH